MSFATAFLGAGESESYEDRISANVQTLLQAISPEWVVGPELVNVQSSNLCCGVPMNWALNDPQNSKQMRAMLRERLNRFEPRFTVLTEIDVQEDVQKNVVTFSIVGAVLENGQNQLIEILTKMSRMDQYAKEAR